MRNVLLLQLRIMMFRKKNYLEYFMFDYNVCLLITFTKKNFKHNNHPSAIICYITNNSCIQILKSQLIFRHKEIQNGEHENIWNKYVCSWRFKRDRIFNVFRILQHKSFFFKKLFEVYYFVKNCIS